jgi:hypothetical protein
MWLFQSNHQLPPYSLPWRESVECRVQSWAIINSNMKQGFSCCPHRGTDWGLTFSEMMLYAWCLWLFAWVKFWSHVFMFWCVCIILGTSNTWTNGSENCGAMLTMTFLSSALYDGQRCIINLALRSCVLSICFWRHLCFYYEPPWALKCSVTSDLLQDIDRWTNWQLFFSSLKCTQMASIPVTGSFPL